MPLKPHTDLSEQPCTFKNLIKNFTLLSVENVNNSYFILVAITGMTK